MDKTSEGSPSNDCEEITKEDIENADKEVREEMKEIGDIDTSNMPNMPDPERLEQLKKILDSMPREQVAQLLANLGRQNGQNILNPNNNSFSTASSQDVLRAKMKQKLNQKRSQRLTKQAKNTQQQRYVEKLQEMQKKREEVSTNKESEKIE